MTPDPFDQGLIPQDLPPGSPLAALQGGMMPGGDPTALQQPPAGPPPSALAPGAPPAQPPGPPPGPPQPPAGFQGAPPSALAPRPPPGSTGPQQTQSTEEALLQRAYERSEALQAAMAERMGLYQQGASALRELLMSTAGTLRATPVGPSSAERWGMIASAMGTPTRTGTFGERMGNVGAASAQALAQQRQAELDKQGLLARYGLEAGELGMQIPMAGLQQLSSQMNANDARMTSLALGLGRQNPLNAPVINVNGVPQVNQPFIQAKAQQAALSAEAVQKIKMSMMSGQFTPEALDMIAENVYRTGPAGLHAVPYGLTRNDPTIIPRIWDAVAAKAAADNNSAAQTAANWQVYHAGSQALGALTKQGTLVTAYEKSAEKAFETALAQGEQVSRLGSPFFNSGIIAWKRGIQGDKHTAGFVDAITAAENEYARVLSAATGAAGITDAARAQAHDLFSKVDSQEMLRYMLGEGGTARQIMHNRTSSFNDQQNVLNDLMTKHGPGAGKIVGETGGAQKAAAPARPASIKPEERAVVNDKGEWLVLRNNQWVPP